MGNNIPGVYVTRESSRCRDCQRGNPVLAGELDALVVRQGIEAVLPAALAAWQLREMRTFARGGP